MNNPKIVIYMPCYNHEKYIRDAVDSILNQTYPNWELYIVNDGSTDRTGDILATYQDERIHYYEFKENTKHVGASNFLQKKIKDLDVKYIAVMASDDKWKEDKFEKQLELLSNNPEYKACFTWDKIIFETEEGVYKKNETYSHVENKNRYDWINHFFTFGNCLNATSMLMEKDIFYELGRMNQYYIQFADYRLWFKFVEKYPFYLIEDELTYYRRHGSNLSEPTLEVCLRGYNEGCHIISEIINPMEKHTFRRAFYKNLSYTNCNSQEELLAEKFMLLMNSKKSEYEQVAMDLYFNFCENEHFTSILDKKYGFGAHEFIHMTGNAGMSYSINLITANPVIPKKESKLFSPAFTLLNMIDRGNLNKSFIPELMYSTLLDLYEVTSRYEGGNKQFLNIKCSISKIRKEITKKKLLYIVADTTDLNAANIADTMTDERLDYFIAFVPTKKEAFHGREAQTQQLCIPENITQINLYNREEHCIYFLNEISKDADIICYVDCLDNRYECNDMLAGYSLGIEYRCILQEDIYHNIMQDDNKVLQVMDDIKVY